MALWASLKRVLVGAPRDIQDPRLFHKISLAAFLAWVGLGADGLSSSAYGPDEAYRTLGTHHELALLLAGATAFTVFVISYAYSRMIEHFPSGGGGYVVATKLLGAPSGLVSGCALLVDYVLTITVSIVSGVDQIFSFLPIAMQSYKVPVAVLALAALVVMNLRGVKESVKVLLPIFLLFLLCHALLLCGALATRSHEVPAVLSDASRDLRSGVSTLGVFGLLLILARAYGAGAGTYTGIEAVSNGLSILREPRVATAKRTMAYMAVSLAVTAGGILLAYMLLGVREEPGKTLNAVLLERLGFGTWFVVVTLVSEAALLCVGAQAGFIDGPRVLANMALDSWVPHRFRNLSERLTLRDGILLMGIAAIATLLYTHGDIHVLVTMYAINVFITFSLTQAGMCRFWIQRRRTGPAWRRALPVHGLGLVLCVSILIIMVLEKFFEGAWVTLGVTAVLVGVCVLIRRYYQRVVRQFARLAEEFEALPQATGAPVPKAGLDAAQPTAALLVSHYGGLGVHSLLSILRTFPRQYEQVVFVSVAVMDSGNFKGLEEIDRLKTQTQQDLDRFVAVAHRLGLAATSMTAIGTDPVDEAERLCLQVAARFPKTTFFGGNLIFEREKWHHRLLHNDTAFAIQRRLHWQGLPMVILPIRAFR